MTQRKALKGSNAKIQTQTIVGEKQAKEMIEEFLKLFNGKAWKA